MISFLKRIKSLFIERALVVVFINIAFISGGRSSQDRCFARVSQKIDIFTLDGSSIVSGTSGPIEIIEPLLSRDYMIMAGSKKELMRKIKDRIDWQFLDVNLWVYKSILKKKCVPPNVRPDYKNFRVCVSNAKHEKR